MNVILSHSKTLAKQINPTNFALSIEKIIEIQQYKDFLRLVVSKWVTKDRIHFG